jgi:hypothetical protein
MRAMIENYRNLPAGHCGSGAMRNLIYHYTGLELEEGVVFGLGAGLDTVFFTYEAASPPIMLFGRGSSMETDLAETLGMDYSEQVEPDNDRAWTDVRAEVIAGRPTMLSGDILYLDYREFKVHFPAHRFVLLGFDDEREEVYIADRVRAEPETCSMQALRLSRNPPEAISTYNAWGRFASGAVRHSLPEACGLALYKTVTRMHGIDQSQLELMGAAQGNGGSEIAVGLKGLLTFSRHLQGWNRLDNAADYVRYVDNAIIKYGTGGGFFRNHFAVFMSWARGQRPDLVSVVTEQLAHQAAALWNDLSPTMQQLAERPQEQDLWQQAQAQVDDIYETEYSLFGHLGDTVLRGG